VAFAACGPEVGLRDAAVLFVEVRLARVEQALGAGDAAREERLDLVGQAWNAPRAS